MKFHKKNMKKLSLRLPKKSNARLSPASKTIRQSNFLMPLLIVGPLHETQASLKSLAAGFKEKAITDLISSPTLSRSEILKKLTSIFDGEVNELVNNLLGALAENDRLEICPEISNLYESLLAEHNQQLDIDVSIPVDLGDESKEGLKQSILKKYGETSNINFLVDPAIMGGITIKIDDEILDLSIKGRVQKLVNELNI